MSITRMATGLDLCRCCLARRRGIYRGHLLWKPHAVLTVLVVTATLRCAFEIFSVQIY